MKTAVAVESSFLSIVARSASAIMLFAAFHHPHVFHRPDVVLYLKCVRAIYEMRMGRFE